MAKHVPGKHVFRHVPVKHVSVRHMLRHVLKHVHTLTGTCLSIYLWHVPQNRHHDP